MTVKMESPFAVTSEHVTAFVSIFFFFITVVELDFDADRFILFVFGIICIPAKVLLIGAGVAGLSAIGPARGLGAIVRAFDTRESVRDQIKSLGGEFLTVEIEESGEGGGGKPVRDWPDWPLW